MEILQATLSDARQILNLQRRAYQQEAKIYDDYAIPPLTQSLEEIQVAFESEIFLKAVESGRIIGSVRADVKGMNCRIGRLIVEPERQGQGIGSLLMAAAEKRFKNCKRFELFTGTKSEGNIRLYKRLGYQPFKQERIHPGLSLLYLEKNRV